MVVYKGASAQYCTVSNGGSLTISSGGSSEANVVRDGGVLKLLSSGTASLDSTVRIAEAE